MALAIFTSRNEVGARLCFTRVCDSVHRGGGVCHTPPWADTPMGRHPPGQTPLGRHPPGQTLSGRHLTWADTPVGRHPPRQTPGRHPPGQTPPPSRHGTTSGRYASYWNAILCVIENNGVMPWIGLQPPFSRDSIDFDQNSITSIIAELLQSWCRCLV